MHTKNMGSLDGTVKFDLRGPLHSVYVGPGGDVMLVDRPSLKDQLESAFPGCVIEDNRSAPDLDVARKSAASIRDHYRRRRQVLDTSDDLSPS